MNEVKDLADFFEEHEAEARLDYQRSLANPTRAVHARPTPPTPVSQPPLPPTPPPKPSMNSTEMSYLAAAIEDYRIARSAFDEAESDDCLDEAIDALNAADSLARVCDLLITHTSVGNNNE
jgi:hypothetical protein